MREKDIKILWGRSGNRCAVCKLEMTLDGSRETLGEMAHIVARSSDGPRGSFKLPSEQRDSYDNLILLCPTHHSEVDKDVANWPSERLNEIKAAHERWVSERLDAGQISVQPVDNSAFLQARRDAWRALAQGNVAIVVALTPLRALMETLDPLTPEIVRLLESARVPNGNRRGSEVNRYRTRPTSKGIANEDFRENIDRPTYSIQIFRVGHCEYFWDLGPSVRYMAENSRSENADLAGAKVIRHTHVAKIVDFASSWLWTVWHSALPYTYMTLTVRLINISETVLYSKEYSRYESVLGFRVTEDQFEYSDIVPRDTDVNAALLSSLQRVVNAYGLVLQSVCDDAGEYVRPERMR
jgi:hypothetical protein